MFHLWVILSHSDDPFGLYNHFHVHVYHVSHSYSSGNTNIDDGVVYGHVSSLVVRPSYRRRGFAMMLMEEFEKACRDELGCTFINFNVNHKNKAALSLYGKLGYSVHSTLPGYYQDASDALEMRKTIAT